MRKNELDSPIACRRFWLFVLMPFSLILLLLVRVDQAEMTGFLTPDPALQHSLREMIETMNLAVPLAERRLAVSLVDVSDVGNPRYAGLNDNEMMYAASLPKICVLVAGFERIREGT